MAGPTAITGRDGEYPPLTGLNLVLLTIAVSISSFMEILDMTIVNVSVPSISGSLGVSPAEGTWAISSYMLAAAVVQPLAGWIGRRFGEVRSFVASLLLFVAFSALCGLATSMPMLVAFRIMQGFVSGPLMAVAQALLLRNYPPQKRGMAMGLWAMVVIFAPICGPILGGTITDNLSWPWLFYINVPTGLIAAATTWMLLRKRESKTVKVPIDIVGLILLVVGVGSLQFMLDNGNEKDWFSSPEILTAAVIAVVALSFLIPWELTDPHPMVDLRLFKGRNFLVGTLAVAVAFFAFSGVNVIYPLWLQTTLNYTSTWAGYAVAPVGVLALFIAPVLGRNIHRVNMRLVPTIAFLVFASSLYWVSTLNETATFGQLSLPRLFQGIGVSLFFLPLNQIIFSGVAPNELANAAGLSNFIRTMSGSISTAVCVWLWNTRSIYHHAVLTESVNARAPGSIHYLGVLSSKGIPDVAARGYVDHVITGQASTMGANDVFLLLAVLFLVAIPVVWFARPPFGTGGMKGGH